MKIHTVADVPDELAHAWLQHLRDFDTAHPGCHFEVLADASDASSVADMVEAIKVAPDLAFKLILRERRR